jgi:hypothetical protein
MPRRFRLPPPGDPKKPLASELKFSAVWLAENCGNCTRAEVTLFGDIASNSSVDNAATGVGVSIPVTLRMRVPVIVTSSSSASSSAASWATTACGAHSASPMAMATGVRRSNE